jgi:hypothetical protein
MKAHIKKILDEKLAGLEHRQKLRAKERDFATREQRLHRMRRSGEIKTLSDLTKISTDCGFQLSALDSAKAFGCTIATVAGNEFVFGPDERYIGWNS